jgi:glycerophosphoryl diester phosphodiesterase
MSRRTRLLSVLVLAGLVLLVALGWDRAQIVTGWGLPARTDPPMLIVAHRGNMARWPEDTAEAIWDAARLGADGIEFDVHQSADGTWWVMHDRTVDRTTNGTGLISELSDLTLAGLRIDSGPGYLRTRDTAVAPPQLDAVLGGLADYGGDLFIDLQHAVSDDLADLARVLRGRRVIVICRSTDDIVALKAIDPSMRTLLRVNRVRPDAPPDLVFLEAVSEATVGFVAQQQLPVATYLDNRYALFADAWVLRRAWAAGVDVYLTKELELALAQVQELEREAVTGP